MLPRIIALWISMGFAILAPLLQSLASLGLSAAEFSYQGDSTLRVAGYAFSIWGPLYFGMLAFAIYGSLPKARSSKLVQHFMWPATIAFCGCGAWIVAAAANLAWLTVIIIAASAVILIRALVSSPNPVSSGETRWVLLPLAALAGWLTVATVVNLVTVLTMKHVIASAAVLPAAMASILLALLVARIVATHSRSVVYLLPVIWGFTAIGVAEAQQKQVVSAMAFVAAILLSVKACMMLRKQPKL